MDESTGESRIRLHLSFFELLGNEATDLLHSLKDKEKMECKKEEHKKPASKWQGSKPEKLEKEVRQGKVDIMEDKFGRINVVGATEVLIQTPQHFVELVSTALAHRRTQTTFKNDTSSRSHAICAIRVENVHLREAEDGKIFVVDLAGSENAADAQFHDRSLVKETQLINKSLMALKDCIRNRALSALNPDRYYHIPYRLSKLTLLLKDAFEVESRRQCKTVVFACAAPTVADVAMTLNTLRYAAPIRVGASNRVKAKPNPDNPASWSNAQLREWVLKASNNGVDPEKLCPWESGMQVLRVPETDFIGRTMDGSDWGEKRAKAFYVKLWKLLIDARTAERKEKLKQKEKRDVEKEAEEWLKEAAKNDKLDVNRLREREWESKTKKEVEKREK